jgi:hypothetical protein
LSDNAEANPDDASNALLHICKREKLNKINYTRMTLLCSDMNHSPWTSGKCHSYQDALANLETAFFIARELGPKAGAGLFPAQMHDIFLKIGVNP